METIRQPISVDPFFDQAQVFVKKISRDISLRSAVLDDWNTGEGIEGARIIYDSLCVENCKSQCGTCPLFQIVGEDTPALRLSLRVTLCRAMTDQLDIFPSKQRFLNCKTFEQYQEAFIRWTIEKCQSQELLEAEFKWIRGFRILFLDGIYDPQALRQRERKSKKYIVTETIKRLNYLGDSVRKELTLVYARHFGLI